jgi:hypothetical protein
MNKVIYLLYLLLLRCLVFFLSFPSGPSYFASSFSLLVPSLLHFIAFFLRFLLFLSLCFHSLKGLGVIGRILEWNFKKYIVKMCTRLMWFLIESDGELLCIT